jgi:hypothetical protein
VSDFDSETASDELPTASREGLPPGYRMRAGPHYVEQLTAVNGPMPLRFVPLSAIDEPEAIEPAEVASLARSIRTFGVLHPLLLSVAEGRYQVIAGRKRFHAARAAGLSAVPAFVHHVSGEEANALAAADNLRYGASGAGAGSAGSPRIRDESPVTERSVSLLKHVSQHLAGIASAQRLLVDPGKALAQRAAVDLIHVHTTRAGWLIKAVDLLGAYETSGEHRRTLGGLVDDLVGDFAPESRLTGVPLRVRLDDRAYTARLDKQAFSVGLMGAIVALLPFADTEKGSTLTLTAARSADALTVDIAQTGTLMDAALGRSFFDAAWTTRPGGWPALMGALAFKIAVERNGGSVACEADASRAHIHLTLPEKR